MWKSGDQVVLHDLDRKGSAYTVVEEVKQMFGVPWIRLRGAHKLLKLEDVKRRLTCGMCMGTGKVSLDRRCPQCFPGSVKKEEVQGG